MGTEGRGGEGEKHKAEVGQKLGNCGLAVSRAAGGTLGLLRVPRGCWGCHRSCSRVPLEHPAGLGTSAGLPGVLIPGEVCRVGEEWGLRARQPGLGAGFCHFKL